MEKKLWSERGASRTREAFVGSLGQPSPERVVGATRSDESDDQGINRGRCRGMPSLYWRFKIRSVYWRASWEVNPGAGGKLMMISKLMCVCVCLVGFTSPVWSQNQPSQVPATNPTPGVAGYLNPQTGTFTTRAKVVPNAETTPTTSILARLIFNFSILNDQTNPITCSVSIAPEGDTGGFFYSEYASFTAPGGSSTCSVTILFSWNLATPTSDTISVEYSLTSGGGAGDTSRGSTGDIPSVAMPTNFQTVTVPTISATI
jgi:hypothetical protein